jgi:hypothetical protein
MAPSFEQAIIKVQIPARMEDGCWEITGESICWRKKHCRPEGISGGRRDQLDSEVKHSMEQLRADLEQAYWSRSFCFASLNG